MIITLQYRDGFCLYQHELAMGAHVSPHPETLPTLPSPPHLVLGKLV